MWRAVPHTRSGGAHRGGSCVFLGIVLELERGSNSWLQLLGVWGWVCSGISRLAEAQGPPLRSDVTNSSRECFTFLFLAVVRSFPASWGKNTVGLFSGAFGSREWREPEGWDWKHMVALRVSLALAPLLPCYVIFLKLQDIVEPPLPSPPTHSTLKKPFILSHENRLSFILFVCEDYLQKLQHLVQI